MKTHFPQPAALVGLSVFAFVTGLLLGIQKTQQPVKEGAIVVCSSGGKSGSSD